jgi:pimeloyl-ACP methyl ester carboxylesterase
MKKIMKVLLIIVLILVVIIAAVLGILAHLAKEKTDHYYKHSDPVGAIETKYTAMGSLETKVKEYKTGDDTVKKIVIWYPSELENSDKAYPVVVWANGTGSTSSTYTAFFRHLASWGFIVVGNDDENTRTGESLNKGIDLLIQENSSEDSVFYQKIDLDRIGIGGHSQGGPAVFNMATDQPHADMVKAIYAVSPTSSYHTKVFDDDWQYDISKVTVPAFLTAGTGYFDAGTATSADQESDEKAGIMQGICPLWSLEENFGLLPEAIDKAYARKTGVDHGDSYLQFDGYMTAWFRYYLMHDGEAGSAFFGDNAELAGNTNYQDVKIHKGE